jgi:DNA-binding NarL/FixJ family response regulator
MFRIENEVEFARMPGPAGRSEPEEVAWLAERRQPALDGPPLRVLVVDDRELVHYGVRLLIAARGSGRCVGATTIGVAIGLAQRYELNVALIDHFVDGQSGLLIAQALREVNPSLQIVLMTAAEAPSPAALAHASVHGCVRRDETARNLMAALTRAACGDKLSPPEAPADISARELEVIRGLANGWTNAQIAASLFLSVNTVKGHTQAVYKKLEARNRAQAVVRAQRLGLVA